MMLQAYLVTHKDSGKSYIGITSRGFRRRWTEHLYASRKRQDSCLLSRAIAKYGVEAFSTQVVCETKSWADLCMVESILIEQFGTRHPSGYNLSDGGEGPYGCKRSADSVERSAAKHRGKPCHPNTRRAASEFHRGRKKSAETRAKMSAARMGEVRSVETRAKISAAKIGRSCNAGESNGQAKLTEAQVRETRIRLGSGESQRSIARSFGIHWNAIWKIANGLKWKSA